MTLLEFHTGIAARALDPARPQPIDTPWGKMAIFDLGSEIVCVQAFCPHLDGPLFEGSVGGGEVTCPWHFWRFDLRTGRRTDMRTTPLGGVARSITTCKVHVDPDGRIVLDAPRARGSDQGSR
jgi:nitrite reductase/ring-hydroxylating ferredoxin subunit